MQQSALILVIRLRRRSLTIDILVFRAGGRVDIIAVRAIKLDGIQSRLI